MAALRNDKQMDSRVTVIGPSRPYRGGIVKHTEVMVARLRQSGHMVNFESWNHQYPKALYRGQVAESVDTPLNDSVVSRNLSWFSPLSWMKLARRIRTGHPILIFVATTPFQYPIFYLILLFSGPSARCRAKLIVHNVQPHESGMLDRLSSLIFLRRMPRALVHTSQERQAAVRLGNDAYCAPLPPFFQLGDEVEPCTDTFWRISFVGYVRPYKGLDVLISALRWTDPRVRLVVHGEFWEGREKYDSLLQEFGLESRVVLNDSFASEEQLQKTIRESDALVLPYLSATGSQMVRHAHSLRTPAIASRVGSFGSEIRDGVDGMLFSVGDSVALAQCIDRLYEPGVLAAMRDESTPPLHDSDWNSYLRVLLES